jgi:hypothetical protein
MFYALMPGDNPASVAASAPVQFPQTFGFNQPGVNRNGPSHFTLLAIGTYEVSFQVSVTEAGQLCVFTGATAGTEANLAYTVVGRATGTSQIVGHVLVRAPVASTSLSIRNCPGNSPALTITPVAGGTNAVSATLLIKRVA